MVSIRGENHTISREEIKWETEILGHNWIDCKNKTAN